MCERREMENIFDLLTLGMREGENAEDFWSIKLNSKGLKVVSKNCFREAKNKNYTGFGRKTNRSSWRKCIDYSFLVKPTSLDTRFWKKYAYIFYLCTTDV